MGDLGVSDMGHMLKEHCFHLSLTTGQDLWFHR